MLTTSTVTNQAEVEKPPELPAANSKPAAKFSVKDILELPTRHSKQVRKMLGLNEFLSTYSTQPAYNPVETSPLPKGRAEPQTSYPQPPDFLPFGPPWHTEDSKSAVPPPPYFGASLPGQFFIGEFILYSKVLSPLLIEF